MDAYFLEKWNISSDMFTYVVLPLLIFFARVCDVSLSTIRILFVMNGKRLIAPILGFFEALIWLLAIGQIITNVDNVMSYLAYASGFAAGTFVGMYIEERLAVGMVVLRLIAKKMKPELIDFFHENNFRYSIVDGKGKHGDVNVMFLVVKREKLDKLIEGINIHHPKAFYTVEGVRQVNEVDQFATPPSKGLMYRFKQLKRK